MYSPFVNKQCTRIHKARLVDMPNRRRPAPLNHPLPPETCGRVGGWDCGLDKQDDQRQLQLSSFKRMPSVVALWETEPKRLSRGAVGPLSLPPFSFLLLHRYPHHGYGHGCGSSSSTKPISQKTKKA